MAAAPARVWAALLNPAVLAAIIPGALQVDRESELDYRALLSFGVGPFRARYDATLRLSSLEAPRSLTMDGMSAGRLGGGQATGHVVLHDHAPGRTAIDWAYTGSVTGPVSLAGDMLLRHAASVFVRRFFAGLQRLPFDGEAGSVASPGPVARTRRRQAG